MPSANRAAFAHDPSDYIVGDELYALGRYGQKTGRGFYRYEGRQRQDDYEVSAIAERPPASCMFAAARSATRKSTTAACSC